MGEALRFFPHSSVFLLSVVRCQLSIINCQLSIAKEAYLFQQLYLKFNHPETGVV